MCRYRCYATTLIVFLFSAQDVDGLPEKRESVIVFRVVFNCDFFRGGKKLFWGSRS